MLVSSTYAVELSADEAIAAGASSVSFSQPVVLHVDNFLGFPVGGAVPTGYYDREKGVWVASKNGRVIQVLSIGTDGKAVLDTDGDGMADSSDALSALGIDEQELAQIGAEIAAGKSFWRVEIQHLTPWDCNWPYGPPQDAISPSTENSKPPVKSNKTCGSIIGCEDQTLGEVLPIAGTPFTLHYMSDRTPGRAADRTVVVSLSGASVPASLKKIRVEVSVAGRLYLAAFDPAPNLSYTVAWDGKDTYGRAVQGRMPALVKIHYDYPAQYYTVGKELNASFAKGEAAGDAFTADRTAAVITESTSWTTTLGPWDARGLGLGGWSLNIHHVYDFAGGRLLLGDGDENSAQVYRRGVISTVAGSSVFGHDGDGGQAVNATLGKPMGLALGADGSLFVADPGWHLIRRIGPDGVIATVGGKGGNGGYDGDNKPAAQSLLYYPMDVALSAAGTLFVADSLNNRIRRVGQDGIITTVAGKGTCGFSGDGGKAVDAALCYPTAVAVDASGNVFIADHDNGRIRRVDAEGNISTVAGTGTCSSYSGDGVPAIQACIKSSNGLASGQDGSLYIAGDGRIIRVQPNGIIKTVAGTGWPGYGGDGGPATAALINSPHHMALGADGALFFADPMSSRIRRIGQDGIITTIAGTYNINSYEDLGPASDGGPATSIRLGHPYGVALAPSGSLYLSAGNRIRLVQPPFPGSNTTDIAVASEDGREVYLFDKTGRHLKTLDADTSAVHFVFGYNANGYLTSITDTAGNVTTIERQGATATAIVAPFGQRTVLSVNSGGWLATLTDPASATHSLDYSADGLLQHFTDPLGNIHTFKYDGGGLLIKDEDPAGGSTTLARAEQARGYTVTTTSALGRAHSYQVESLTTGGTRRTTTAPSGTQTVTTIDTDGSELTNYPDGSSVVMQRGPDQRWGMVAPITKSVVTTTPAGLKSTVATTRNVTLSKPGDLWSMTKQTDTVTVNSKNWMSAYDATSRQVTRTSPMGRTRITTLDEKGRLAGVSVPGLAPVTVAYDDKGRPSSVTQGTRQTVFAYDAQGYLSRVTDPLSRAVTLENDAVGRMKKQTGPDQSQMLFGYDASSNVTSVTPPGRTAYTFGYSAIDQETSFTPPSVGTWDPTTAYSYDYDRALKNVTMPDGASIGTTYDSAGRVERVDYPKGWVKLGYDATTGHLASASNTMESLGWTYDGPLVTKATLTGTVNGTVGYTYNNDFRLQSTTVNGNPSSTATLGYDNDGLLTSVGTAAASLSLTRDPDNGMLKYTTAGKVTETLDYNEFGEVKSYTAKANSTALLAITYTRDSLGRISQKVETIGGVTTTYDYGYDTANRLKEVKQNGTVVRSWEYDAAGNRKSDTKDGTTVSADYDAQDRLKTYGTASYTFGNAGNLQTRTQGSQRTTYVYDALGNLVSAQLPDGKQLEYVVDAAGRRVGKKVNGTLVQGFLWEGQLRIAAELDGSGNVVSRFVYGAKVNVPELIIKDSGTYRVITDHLGSPRVVVHVATGNVAQRMDYDEWGNALGTSMNPGFQPFGFAGGLWDRDTGLVRFGFRDYDASTGRWTTKDPLGLTGGINLYEYCGGDPENWVDPSGKFGWVLPVAGAAVGAAASIYANWERTDLTWQQKAQAALFSAGTGALAALPSGILGSMLAGGASGFANNLLNQSFMDCGSIKWANAGWSAAAGAGAGFLSGLLGRIGQQFLRSSPVIGETLPGTYAATGVVPPIGDFAVHGGIMGNAIGTGVATTLGY